MIKINVISNNILWNKYVKNPKLFINEKVKLINKKNTIYKKNIFTCTLLLSGTKEIKQLNKKFRNKNKSTDVLSFPFYEKKHLIKIINNEKEIYLGDIIINLNKVKNKTNKKLFREQFNKLWIHGLLHLFGYTHKKNREFLVMQKLEHKFFMVLK
tara:strand:+ start:770 stop:1234 length:465 start_codon:yes stop_codon:yes gene_type:complete